MQKTLSVVLLITILLSVSCKSRKKDAKPWNYNTDKYYSDDQVEIIQKKLPGSTIQRTDEGIKVTFSSEILFPINSSILTDRAKEVIAELVKSMEELQSPKILIEGHSDATGTPEYNKWLSEKRAVSVKRYAETQGIAESKISTAGYGDTKPVAQNNTPEGRAKNRRVEITFFHDEK